MNKGLIVVLVVVIVVAVVAVVVTLSGGDGAAGGSAAPVQLSPEAQQAQQEAMKNVPEETKDRMEAAKGIGQQYGQQYRR